MFTYKFSPHLLCDSHIFIFISSCCKNHQPISSAIAAADVISALQKACMATGCSEYKVRYIQWSLKRLASLTGSKDWYLMKSFKVQYSKGIFAYIHESYMKSLTTRGKVTDSDMVVPFHIQFLTWYSLNYCLNFKKSALLVLVDFSNHLKVNLSKEAKNKF